MFEVITRPCRLGNHLRIAKTYSSRGLGGLPNTVRHCFCYVGSPPNLFGGSNDSALCDVAHPSPFPPRRGGRGSCWKRISAKSCAPPSELGGGGPKHISCRTVLGLPTNEASKIVPIESTFARNGFKPQNRKSQTRYLSRQLTQKSQTQKSQTRAKSQRPKARHATLVGSLCKIGSDLLFTNVPKLPR